MQRLRRTPVEHVLPLNRRGEGVARVGSGGLRIVVVLVIVVLPHTHPVPGHLPDPRAGSEKITIGSPLKVLSRDGRVIQILNKLDCTARVRGKQGE